MLLIGFRLMIVIFNRVEGLFFPKGNRVLSRRLKGHIKMDLRICWVSENVYNEENIDLDLQLLGLGQLEYDDSRA